jgi:sodium transport system permease protein
MMRLAWLVFTKEIVDALRDRRTLLAATLSSVVVGPLVLLALSALVGGEEQRARAREALVAGLDAAPTLRNFLERQGTTLREAPVGYEAALREGRLSDAVLVVAPGFEAELAAGRAPRVEVVSSGASTRAEGAAARLSALLRGFAREQQTLRLAARGVAPQLLEVVRVEERDMAGRGARTARILAMLPFFLLLAVMVGAQAAALDTTAGERERGSLEPLLMNPVPPQALVLGKWGAVACVGMLVAVVACLSFLPARWLIDSESLQVALRYGPRELAWFLALLLPLAAAVAAVLMAMAIRSKSVKEAQATTGVLLLASGLMPMVTMLGDGRSADWGAWVPVLAQTTLMAEVLKGDPIAAVRLLPPLAVALAVTLACLTWLARQLRRAAVQ